MRKSFLIGHKKKFVLYRIRKNLLAIITGLFAVFAIFSMLLMYLSERRIYQQSMKEMNEVMTNQVVAVYELYLQSVKEIARETVFNNQELLKLSSDERNKAGAKKEILNLLDSVSMRNSCIHSAYLYYEEDGLVYSSLSAPYSITHLSAFGDKTVFSEKTAVRPYQIGPHLLNTTAVMADPKEQPLLISYVVPAEGSGGTVRLCVNVDARALYSMILSDFEMEQNKNFYLVSQDGYVVFHRNPEYLFIRQEELPEEETVIRSEVYSRQMNLTVVFENTVPPLKSRFPQFAMWILAGLLVALVIMSITVIYSTLPINKMVQIAKKSELRDFLTKSGEYVDAAFWEQAMDASVNHVVSVFRLGTEVAAEEFLRESIKNAAENEKKYRILEIKMSADTIAIIFGNTKQYSEEQFRRYVKAQCEEMFSEFKKKNGFYGVLSQVRTGGEMLRASYQECLDTLQYQFLFPYQVIGCEEIDRGLPVYPFPVRHERHIINNIMTGKEEACIRHVDAIFEEVTSGNYLIKDSGMKRYLEIMEENIALRLSDQSLPVDKLERNDYEFCNAFGEVHEIFLQYVHEILAQLAHQPHEEEDHTNSRVLEYIEEHFCENDICLQKIAAQLSLSTTQISRVVKEASHRTFSEYITMKRISRSKELLAEEAMSINEVSEAVGFTYPYYFIRKFKELEGVTPGQYIGIQMPPDQLT